MVTPAGTFSFQEWFVARGHRDEVDGVRFEGAEAARPAPGVLEALETADLVAIAWRLRHRPTVRTVPVTHLQAQPEDADAILLDLAGGA